MKITFFNQLPSTPFLYGFAVFIRLSVCFVLGYVCSALVAVDVAYVLQFFLPKAEAVFLAAFIALIFYISFVLILFCVQRLGRMLLYSSIIWLFLFIASRLIG